ncbi:MAG: hypothetical protein IJ223_02670 [Clostridia bacterium]|nr:hypothetical protein [Clostridia bacterium]
MDCIRKWHGAGNLFYIATYTDAGSNEQDDNVLPVVTLKYDVENLGGDGTSEHPWIFQVTE